MVLRVMQRGSSRRHGAVFPLRNVDPCGVCRWHPTEATMRHVSIKGGTRSQPVVFQQYISISKWFYS